MIGIELASVAMGHSSVSNKVFHNHYSRLLMYEDLVGLQFGDHIQDPVLRAEAKVYHPYQSISYILNAFVDILVSCIEQTTGQHPLVRCCHCVNLRHCG